MAAPRRALVALSAAAALAPFGSTMIAAALPAMGQELRTDAGTLTQWLVTSYLVANTVAQSPAGKLGDVWGYQRTIALGQAIIAASSAMAFFSSSVPVLGATRVASAIGGALIVPSGMALVRSQTPADQRSRAFGVFGAVMLLAAGVGSVMGGELTARFGWRSIFLVSLSLVVVSVVMVRAVAIPPRPPSGERSRFDLPGSVLLTTGLGLALVGTRASGARSVGLIAAALAVLAIFAAWERRAAEPLLAVGLFRSRVFAGSSVIYALQNLVLYTQIFQLPYFFFHVRHIGPESTGRALAAPILAAIALAPVGGRATERFGARVTVCVGLLASMAGVWLLRDVDAVREPRDAVPMLLLLGAGVGLSTAPLQAAAMNACLAEQSGTAAGVFSTMRSLGGVAGVAILGAFLGGEGEPLLRHRAAYSVFAGVLALSAVVALMLPGRPRNV